MTFNRLKAVEDTYKKYNMQNPSGKWYQDLQGYERFFIISNEFRDNEIRHGEEVPRICYRYAGKSRTYIPDFWIPGKGLIIEVKSPYTLACDREKNRRKREACIAQGHRFEYRVYSQDGARLENVDETLVTLHENNV
jgi:hypothetical protein